MLQGTAPINYIRTAAVSIRFFASRQSRALPESWINV